MKTALLAGRGVPPFDKDIIGNILLDKASEAAVRDELMVVGIRNAAGEIYRLIGASTSRSFTNAVEELEDMGLVNEIDGEGEPVDGCDAIFSAA